MFKIKNETISKIMCYIPGLTPSQRTTYDKYENWVKSVITERKLKPETIKAISIELSKLRKKSISGNVQFINPDIEYHYSLATVLKSNIYTWLYWNYSSKSYYDVGVMAIFEIVYGYATINEMQASNKQHKKITALLESEEIYDRISQ